MRSGGVPIRRARIAGSFGSVRNVLGFVISLLGEPIEVGGSLPAIPDGNRRSVLDGNWSILLSPWLFFSSNRSPKAAAFARRSNVSYFGVVFRGSYFDPPPKSLVVGLTNPHHP